MNNALSRAPLSGSAMFAVELDPATKEVVMLDQRKLPSEVVYYRYRTADEVSRAITEMVVRGAPAIGIAAAYGLVLQAYACRGDLRQFLIENGIASKHLNKARPTAVNLAWAIARMGKRAAEVAALAPDERAAALQAEAEAIHSEDVAACRAMGLLGAERIKSGATVLTHCNAGALATGGYGTALGVIRAAHEQGKNIRVLADETRPYLQGARLTAFELAADGIPVEVITDSMAGHFFQKGAIDFVVVGSDRIAANGDVANKIGTYSVAVLANAHDVPFTVAAPFSTVDLHCPSGDLIPIEERSRDEVARLGSSILVADGIGVRHPAFDVTPARLVSEVFTELGAFSPKNGGRPADLLKR
jgi:methylthioribose-1-phosphate isomerase